MLVGALVVADLAEQVGQAPVLAVLRRVDAGVGLGLQLGVLGHVGHVLVLGVVLEVGVEPVAPVRADHEEQPGHVVEEERDQPRRQPVQQERLPQAAALHEILQDQQVPLLVVLVGAGLDDALEHPPGQRGPAAVPGQRQVAHPLPGLVGHPGDELEHGELDDRPFPAVGQVHRREQGPGQQAVPEPGRVQGFRLRGPELMRRELGRARRDLGAGGNRCDCHGFMLRSPMPPPRRPGAGSCRTPREVTGVPRAR